MALPTRAKQIAAVAALLEKAADADPPLSLEELAEEVVDGYHSLIDSSIKKPVKFPHTGMAFKTPISSKVAHVAWSDEEWAWCVSGDSRYGFFVATAKSDYWSKVEVSTAKSGAPGHNPDWNVGDQVLRGQIRKPFTVLATGDKCVLLQDLGPIGDYPTWRLQPESNDNMKIYYKRERTPLL